jgi:hypothetical protein
MAEGLSTCLISICHPERTLVYVFLLYCFCFLAFLCVFLLQLTEFENTPFTHKVFSFYAHTVLPQDQPQQPAFHTLDTCK